MLNIKNINYNNDIIKNQINKNIKLNKKVNLYFNLKNSDGKEYIDKETDELSLFITGNTNNFNNEFNYKFITLNSLNPNKFNDIKISNERINFILSRMLPFSNEYKYKENGIILIILNNINGWFKNYYKDNLENLLKKLIKNIKKITKRKIVVRLHPKNRNKILNIDINMNIDNNTPLIKLMGECYCCFIQNTKLMFDFINYGVPLFNLNFYDINYFNDIYIKFINLNNLNNILLPDRQKFIKKYYKFIYFNDELDFNKILSNYNIK